MRCSARALTCMLSHPRWRHSWLVPRPWQVAVRSALHMHSPLPLHHLGESAMAAVYKPTEAIQLLRPCTRRHLAVSRRRGIARAAFSTSRCAKATHSSTSDTNPPRPSRRHVTVTNDTGTVRWNELSPAEKAARTVQQSFNLSIVVVGIVFTVRLSRPTTS